MPTSPQVPTSLVHLCSGLVLLTAWTMALHPPLLPSTWHQEPVCRVPSQLCSMPWQVTLQLQRGHLEGVARPLPCVDHPGRGSVPDTQADTQAVTQDHARTLVHMHTHAHLPLCSFTHTHTHSHAYTHDHTQSHTCAYKDTKYMCTCTESHTCTRAHTHARVHSHTRSYTQTHTHMQFTCTHIHAHAHTYRYSHGHTHTHAHTNTHIHSDFHPVTLTTCMQLSP